MTSQPSECMSFESLMSLVKQEDLANALSEFPAVIGKSEILSGFVNC